MKSLIIYFLLGFSLFTKTNKATQEDCQTTTRYEMISTTTVKKTTTARAAKHQIPPSVLAQKNDTAWLNISVSNDGNCQWKVEQKAVEKGKVRYSPVGLYVIGALRQSAGDFLATPDRLVEEVKNNGGSTQALGNHTISIKMNNPSDGSQSVALMDTTRCVFLGNSLYEKDGKLKYKVVYHYGLDATGFTQALVSATLFIYDPDNDEISETVTTFRKL